MVDIQIGFIHLQSLIMEVKFRAHMTTLLRCGTQTLTLLKHLMDILTLSEPLSSTTMDASFLDPTITQ